jgi:SAM-dependent methyltransferase
MTIGEQLTEDWLTSLEANATYDRPWVDDAVAWLVDTPPPGPVVDVGCGAGGAACAFAHRLTGAGDQVVLALDREPRLLAQAQRRAADEGVAGGVRFAVGEVGRLPLRPAGAGLVWASGVVHHVADQQAAVDELAGVVAPGGTVALVEGGLPMRCLPLEIGLGRPGLEARLDEARARWFADMRAELGGPPMPYGWPEALARAGLTGVRTRSYVAEVAPPLGDVGRRMVLQHLHSAHHQLGDRLDPDDREVVARLLDPGGPDWVGRRDDLVVTAVRTVHAGTRAPDEM